MSRIERISYWLILLFPVVMISIKIVGPLFYLILSFIGIYEWVVRGKSPFGIKELRLFSWLTVGYFFVMVLSIAFSAEPTNDWLHLSRKIQFLLAPFVGLVLYYSRVPMEKILMALKLGVIIAGGIVWIEWLLGGSDDRLSGMFNPNTFGDIVVVMLWMSLINADKESEKAYRYTIVGIVLGTSAVVVSGSRASMLVYMILLLLYSVLLYKNKALNAKVYRMLFVGVFTFGAVVYLNGTIMNRATLAVSEVAAWEKEENKTTSVGARLEMYRTGIQAFLDSPLIGYGYRNANDVASRYTEGKIKEQIAGYSHLHNEYLTNMVNAGIVGLIMLLALFLMPLRYFILGTIKEDNRAAAAGILLVAGFMLNGILHAALQWEYQNSFFPFFLAYFLIVSEKKNNE